MLLTQMFVAIVSLCHEYLYLEDQYKHIGYLFTNSEFKALYFMASSKSSVVVGWKTSSTRHQHELPKKEDFVDDVRYPHVVYVEKPKAQDVNFLDEMIYQAKTTSELEEVTLKSRNIIPWERVDVSFKRSRQWIFSHSTIQVQLSLPSLALSFTDLSARWFPVLLSSVSLPPDRMFFWATGSTGALSAYEQAALQAIKFLQVR
ncbi:uncharacterized protein [Triticum aestivum]|uniref:uncharacterized protein isoform X2 n=1 Tax=Triticum aestivum TaxID=4565 RepID=UPI001D005398|nr:uncharacterized protein LOC123091691 isoform X2 [Triticum aestivum]